MSSEAKVYTHETAQGTGAENDAGEVEEEKNSLDNLNELTTVVRKKRVIRPKSVQNARTRKTQRMRPNTVHSKTGLARERSRYLKAEIRERNIDNNLSRKEKKRGHAAYEKLDAVTRSAIIHGNIKRAFYNNIKEKLTLTNKTDLYDSLLILEVLSDDSNNHFDILQYRILSSAAEVINQVKTWNLQMWKHIHTVSTTIRNLLEASTRRGYSGGNNTLIYKQNGLSVLVRAACADLFSPSNKRKYNANKPDTFLPQWTLDKSINKSKTALLQEEGEMPQDKISPLLSRYILRAQRVAFEALTILAQTPKNRPSLIRSRVLEVAILVMGGRAKQLEILKKIKLTEGVPRFEGTDSQLAAYQLVQNFDPKDYELMSRLRQSRDINKKFKAADQLLSSLLSGKQPENINNRPSTVPVSLGRPFFQPKHVACAKDGRIKIIQPGQLHIVRGDVSGKRTMTAWAPLVKLLQKPMIMEKLHKYAEEEFEFHKCVEERRLKKEYVTRICQLDNSRFAEKIKLKSRMEKIRYRCSPEGVMEDIRRRNGLLNEDSWWSNRSRKKLVHGLQHRTKKKKKRLPPRAQSIASVSDGLPDLCFDFDPPEHPGRSPFGHCATNGLAWWENYLTKKPRPTREELSQKPVNVELDTEPLSLRPTEGHIMDYHVETHSLMIPRLQPVAKNIARARTTPGKIRQTSTSGKLARAKNKSLSQLSTDRRRNNEKHKDKKKKFTHRTSRKYRHNQTI